MEWNKGCGEDCYFTPLPYLVLITQIVIPIAIGIPAIFLIPNVYQTEDLIDWQKRVGTRRELTGQLYLGFLQLFAAMMMMMMMVVR